MDKLIIDTPEQTQVEFALAGIGSRFLAYAFDFLVQFIVGLGLFLAWGLTLGGVAGLWPQGWTWVTGLFLFLGFLLTVGYFAIFEAIWNGQTPGKRYLAIRVIKDSGRPISATDAIARNLMRIVDQLPGAYAAAIVSMLLSPHNKRLGDYVAGTVVVHEKSAGEMMPAGDGAKHETTPLSQPVRLLPEEVQLIETFLQRSAQLSPEVRAATAAGIANRVYTRLQLTTQEQQDAEEFLQSMLAGSRQLSRSNH